jgi:hypothetical protein
MMKSFWWKACLFLMAVSSCALAQSDAPSLGDIARQNRGAKKKATIVLSDEDQRFSRSATSSQPSASVSQAGPSAANSGSAQASSKTDAGKTDAGKSASAATGKDAPALTSAKQKLDFYKSELEAWKTITKRDEGLLANETVPFRQQMYQDALEGDRRTMAAFKEKVDQMQSEMAKDQKNDSSGSSAK